MFQIKDKTYPDGTKSTATVPVTVIAPNVPDVIYVPKGDKVPDPSTVVTNSNDIKDKIPDTTYTWKTTPDTNTTYEPATSTEDGLMSAADKAKLDSIQSDATNTAGFVQFDSESDIPVGSRTANTLYARIIHDYSA